MSTPQDRLAAEERLAILQRAREFEDLLARPGWKAIFALHTQWVETERQKLRRVDTADVTKALDALQRWQIAEGYLDLEAEYINMILAQAEDIKTGLTLDEALLMEQLKHEQPESRTSDTAGY